MKNIVYFAFLMFFLFFNFGCLRKKENFQYITCKIENFQYITCKITRINENKNFFTFVGLNKITKDSIFIFSKKKTDTDKNFDNSKQIYLDSQYVFKLNKIKIRVGHMEQLGAFMKIDNDTIWKGINAKQAPIYYYSLNTIGLNVLYQLKNK